MIKLLKNFKKTLDAPSRPKLKSLAKDALTVDDTNPAQYVNRAFKNTNIAQPIFLIDIENAFLEALLGAIPSKTKKPAQNIVYVQNGYCYNEDGECYVQGLNYYRLPLNKTKPYHTFSLEPCDDFLKFGYYYLFYKDLLQKESLKSFKKHVHDVLVANAKKGYLLPHFIWQQIARKIVQKAFWLEREHGATIYSILGDNCTFSLPAPMDDALRAKLDKEGFRLTVYDGMIYQNQKEIKYGKVIR